MRILFLARRFYPLIGGVEKHCLLLGKELLKRRHQLTIITEWDYQEISNEYDEGAPKFIGEEEYEGIKIFRIPVTNHKHKKWQIWLWFIKHQKLIRECDLIHCHDVFYWFLPLRLFYPKKKVFLTFHGYEGNQPPNWRKKLAHQIADKLSQGNICIGDFQAKWYGVRPTYVSYGAVGDEVSKFKVQSSKSSGKKYDLCYVGRLAKDVGIVEYLMALKRLKAKGLNLTMAVCGNGPLVRVARSYTKREGLKVDFLGFTEKAAEILANSKIALVSRYLVILEALSLCKPIVAVYDNQIKKDYLAMTPFAKWISIVEKPWQIAEAVEKIIFNNFHSEQGEESSGRSFVSIGMPQKAGLWAKKQSWSKMTDLYLKLWQKKQLV